MITWLADGLPGLLLLSAFALLGIAVLRRTRLGLTRLECIAYGSPVGIVVMSLVLLAVASSTETLSRSLVIGGGATSILVAIVLSAPARRLPTALIWHPPSLPANLLTGAARNLRGWSRVTKPAAATVPALLLVSFVLYEAHFWSQALRYDDAQLVTPLPGVWADWAMHLGDVTSFLWGGNLPAEHPRLIGAPISYHYLSSFTAAAMATLGPDPVVTMTTQSFFLFVFIGLGLYAFGLRLIGHRFAAMLLVPLYLLGGGYGYVALLARVRIPQSDPLTVSNQQVFSREMLRELNFPLPNPEFMFIAQRGFLYGLPLALLTFTLLIMGLRRIQERIERETRSAGEHRDHIPSHSSRMAALAADRPTVAEVRPFFFAGLVAGVIPIGHFSTVYSLILALPAVALLSLLAWPFRARASFRRRAIRLTAAWAAFGVVWVLLTVPQVMWVYGGQIGGTSALRLQLGWLAGAEPWWYFWLKNLGTYALLFPIAVCARGLLDGMTRRFLLGFTSIFVLCNLFAFLPWAWNNSLFLQYWILSVAVFVAALTGKAWARRRGAMVVHVAFLMLFVSIVGLGLLTHLNNFTASERRVLADRSGVELADWIRTETPTDAVFITGTFYSNPVAMLSGRQLVVGYPVYLWTQGLDATEQERDVHVILQWKPRSQLLLEKYDVDYVAIGAWERENLDADRFAAWSRYPAAYTSGPWVVYAVSERAIAQHQFAGTGGYHRDPQRTLLHWQGGSPPAANRPSSLRLPLWGGAVGP
jgi:hypothetical protein